MTSVPVRVAARSSAKSIRRTQPAAARINPGLLLVSIFVATLAVPDSLAPNYAGLHLPFYRMFLVLLLPLALIGFLRARIRFSVPDLLIISFAVLQAISLNVHYGLLATIYVDRYGGGTTPTNILINAGTTFLETVGPYFLARTFVRSRSDVAVVSRVLIAVVLAVSLTTLFEAFAGASIYDNPLPTVRFGLHRANGPFPGPIQWGLFAASAFALSLARSVVGGTWLRRTTIPMLVFIATLTSVSSAAIAAIAIQFLLILWFSVSASLKNRTAYFVAGCVAVYLFVEAFSNRTAVQVLFNYAALDPWTGYYRTLIWQYGWSDFLTSPLVGIGYDDWVRPRWMTPSIDAFWLVLLLRYGALAALPLFLGIAVALRRGVTQLMPQTKGMELDLAYLWLASLASLIIAGFTVHFWFQSVVELFFLVGFWGAFGKGANHPLATGARAGLAS